MDRYPYHEYTILLGATRALAHIGIHFIHRVFALSAGLEDFLDWAEVVDDEPSEEEEMFSLAVGFAAQMRKRPTTPEGEVTSSS